ncbi:hypothetical protein BC826DRAFT_971518 [Russula brevipes]|nr:hypothetical protein BC826DRAFT_971518 [Russula brevipes]
MACLASGVAHCLNFFFLRPHPSTHTPPLSNSQQCDLRCELNGPFPIDNQLHEAVRVVYSALLLSWSRTVVRVIFLPVFGEVDLTISPPRTKGEWAINRMRYDSQLALGARVHCAERLHFGTASKNRAVKGRNPSKLVKPVIAKRGQKSELGDIGVGILIGAPTDPQGNGKIKWAHLEHHWGQNHTGKSHCASTIASLGYGASKARVEERQRAAVLKSMTFFSDLGGGSRAAVKRDPHRKANFGGRWLPFFDIQRIKRAGNIFGTSAGPVPIAGAGARRPYVNLKAPRCRVGASGPAEDHVG